MSAYIIWHSRKDARVCPICRALNGYKFGPYTEIPQALVHPQYGVVWDMASGSAAHEHGMNGTCRCHTEAEIDYSELIELLRKKIEELTNATKEVDDTQSGGHRSTSFEDIGIDPSKYGL